MSKAIITESNLTNIANAIRAKNGASNTYTPSQMATAIQNIVTTPTLQAKTATPATSQQIITADSGYDGLSQVTVNSIPSEYVIPSGEITLDENTVYNVTNYETALVNVSAPTTYTLLHSSSESVNYSSTSASQLKEISISTSAWTKDKMLYVRIRRNSKANGYYYGSDNYYLNYGAANNESTGGNAAWMHSALNINSSGKYVGTGLSGSTCYGIYPYTISKGSSNCTLKIYQKYNSTYGTINGTYNILVYLIGNAADRETFAK